MKPNKPVDVWRMVAAQRSVQACVPLTALPRLAGLLVDTQGEVNFTLEFGRNALCPAFAQLDIQTVLPLQCQRSLQRFGFAVTLRQQLGFIRSEADEAALPPGHEPVLVADNGFLQPLDLVQDELILAIPVLPVAPDSIPITDAAWLMPESISAPASEHPFAMLAGWKKQGVRKA